jgi:hypothetical protein
MDDFAELAYACGASPGMPGTGTAHEAQNGSKVGICTSYTSYTSSYASSYTSPYTSPCTSSYTSPHAQTGVEGVEGGRAPTTTADGARVQEHALVCIKKDVDCRGVMVGVMMVVMMVVMQM